MKVHITYKKAEESESVHLSLFVGYTKGAPESSKLATWLTETKNAALLDTPQKFAVINGWKLIQNRCQTFNKVK